MSRTLSTEKLTLLHFLGTRVFELCNGDANAIQVILDMTQKPFFRELTTKDKYGFGTVESGGNGYVIFSHTMMQHKLSILHAAGLLE
jgi:hypothetical protein